MDKAELQDLLQETALFALLQDDEFRDLATVFEPVHYSMGQTVVRAGDKSDAFYVVAQGRARVVAEKQGEEITVGTLSRGGHFGEQGLLSNSPREFTVRAADELTLCRLRKTDFERLLARYAELARYFANYISELAVRNFLKLSTVLSPLPARDIRDLLASFKVRDYAAETAIIKEGEAGDAFYILRSGNCAVIKESEGGKILNRLRAGDSFGELALLLGQPRAASVITQEPCSVFRLEKADFDRIVAASAKVKAALAGMAAGYSREVVQVPLEPASPPLVMEAPPAPYAARHTRRFPALLQLSEADCGPACLATILRYYRKRVSLSRLRTLAGADREGATLYNLAEAAEAVGFQARGIQTSVETLPRKSLPAIAHWEGIRYVVLYAAGDQVTIADPRTGLRRISLEEFKRSWTGYLLLLTPTPRLDEVEQSKATFSRYLALLTPYRRQLMEILLASVLIQLFNLATPVFTQLVVDRVLVQKSSAMLNGLLFGMILVAVFQTAAVALRKYLMVHTSQRVDLAMATDFYRHTLSLPIRFFEERKVGDILKRFKDNEKIRDLITGKGFLATLDVVMIVVYLGLMVYYNVSLTLVALSFMAAYALLTLGMTPVLKRQNREAFQRVAEAESSLVESVTGPGTVKATAAEIQVRWRWEGQMVRALNARFRTAITSVGTNSINSALLSLNSTVLLWYGARLVIADELTIGRLMAFTALAANMMRPVAMLVELWGDVQEASVGMERLNDVFETRPEEDTARPGVVHLPPARGHIRIENLTFRYPTRPDRNALENINLEIYPGQTVALIGRSGAGKSTFASLLLRLHTPNRGRIFIDGQDIRQVSLSSLRSQVGVVPQDVVLFSGTIRHNIAFGQLESKLEEVVGAAMLAGAHDFIMNLPLGYETVVGERGQSLSGGQRQRIAIARALFRKPRILIFDEATSALDTESERAIQHNMETILKGRTTLVIAHRLSTVRNADLIVVMDAGAIVESGTHFSLMEQRGLYYYLNSQQLEG